MRMRAIPIDLSNYWMLTHLFSFLGIEEAALVNDMYFDRGHSTLHVTDTACIIENNYNSGFRSNRIQTIPWIKFPCGNWILCSISINTVLCMKPYQYNYKLMYLDSSSIHIDGKWQINGNNNLYSRICYLKLFM